MKKFGFIFLLFLFLININKAKAQPLLGSNITWTCVGQDSFLINFVVYTDCNAIPFGATQIGFKCTTTGSTITTKALSPGTPIDITPVCSSTATRCSSASSTFPYGINKYTKQTIVNLSGAGSCCSVKVFWGAGSRTSDITTGAATQAIFVESTLNRCLNPCDNSPTFKNEPLAILCVGQDFAFNYGVTDMDVKTNGGLADSLTYEFAAPLSAVSTPISYTGSYTYDKPFFFWGFPNAALPTPRGLHIDPKTGDIQFRPMKAEVTLMVVQVNEFRNGVKIGEIRRDMTFFVIPCTNNGSPTVSTPNNIMAKTVCAGNTVTFNFTSNDYDTADIVNISWNNAIPGAVWTTTNGLAKHPTATLSWTTTLANAGPLPYTFTVTAKDNKCPLPGSTTHQYQIYVNTNPIPEASITVSDSGCGKYFFKATAISGTSPTFKWSANLFYFSPNTGTLVSQNLLAGSYPFRLDVTALGCTKSYFDTATVAQYMSVYLPRDTIVCLNSTISLQAVVVNDNGPYSLQWGSGNVIFTNSAGSTKQIRITKDTIIWVRATYATFSCPYDEIKIKAFPKFKIGLPDDTFFCNLNHQITPKFSPYKSTYNLYRWYKANSSVTVDSDAYLNVFDTGLFHCVVTDSVGCNVSDSIFIHKTPEVIASAISKVICIGDEALLKADTTGGGNALYYWYENYRLIGNTQSIKVKPTVTTRYTLKVMKTTAGVTCSDSLKVWVSVYQIPIIKINPIDKVCLNGSILNLDNFVTIDGVVRPGGIWSSPSAGLTYGDQFYPWIAGISNPLGWQVKFDFTDPVSGCFAKDSSYVTVLAIPKPFAGYDDSICTGSNIPLTGIPFSSSGSWRGIAVEGSHPKWEFNPDASGLINGGSYNAIYRFIDSNKCANEDTVKITVFSNPIVDAGIDQEFCEYDAPINLIGIPASGIWSGVGVTGNKFYPVLSKSGIHILQYHYTNVICSDHDSVSYVVNPKPPKSIISLNSTDSFLESNLLNGNYEWSYRPAKFTNPTIISGNTRRINPQTYCINCYFSVILTDSNGCVSDTSDLYHFAINSINNGMASSGFVFYPNPAADKLFIENPKNESANFILYDVFGKQVVQEVVVPGKNSINIHNFKSGTYFIFINGMISGKILIE